LGREGWVAILPAFDWRIGKEADGLGAADVSPWPRMYESSGTTFRQVSYTRADIFTRP
jgi:hypothetical protein